MKYNGLSWILVIAPLLCCEGKGAVESGLRGMTTGGSSEDQSERSLQTSCCSWNFKTCGDSTWCNENAVNCGQCNALWITPSQLDPTCVARWKDCEFDSNQCCPGGECRMNWWGYGMCNVGPPPTLMSSAPVRLRSDDGSWYLARSGTETSPGGSVYLSASNDAAANLLWSFDEEGDPYHYRISCLMEPSSGYLNRAEDGNGDAGAAISMESVPMPLWWRNSEKWVMVDNGNGLFQIVNRWSSASGFLTRAADGSSVYIGGELKTDGVVQDRQLWRVETAATSAPVPTDFPTALPTSSPTAFPTSDPTPAPTHAPSSAPSVAPSTIPSPSPSSSPTVSPSQSPSDTPTRSPVHTPAPVASPAGPYGAEPGFPVSVAAGITVHLLKSRQGEVLTLADHDGKPAGRSYDGGDWESVYPNLQLFTGCNANQCSAALPSGASYILISRMPQALTNAEKASRLLIQATFGPTRDSVSEVEELFDEDASTAAADWLSTQLSLPASLHRAHARERSNQRLRQATRLFGIRDPCSNGSRWNRYAFSKLDIGKTIEVTGSASPFMLKIDSVNRSEVVNDPLLPATNVVCSVAEYVGGVIVLAPVDSCDDEAMTTTMANPAIALPGQVFQVASLVDLAPAVTDTKLLAGVQGSCSLAATNPIFVQDVLGDVFMGDPRMESVDNSLGSTSQKPLVDTRECPTAPKTFLNQDTCRVDPDCSPPLYNPTTFSLNDGNIREFYEREGLYVYRIDDLRMDTVVSPCSDSADFHRFVRRDSSFSGCQSETSLAAAIKDPIVAALEAAAQGGDFVVDIPKEDVSCIDAANLATGANITVSSGACWTHSHPDEWSVLDFSSWIMLHPGNLDAFVNKHPHPIAKHAETGDITLNYPGWKPMVRWEDNKWRFPILGNYGDTVDFAALDPKVQGPSIAAFLGASTTGPSDPGFEVCGSPGEVANDPSKGHQYVSFKDGDQGGVNRDTLDQDHDPWNSNEIRMETIAVKAPDQLRQRVAWALSQIFIVTENDIDRDQDSESWGAYHDIMVRHAFGNFRDLLKEVAFSPMMGEMLTFIQTRSLAFNIEELGLSLFPDENFAREICQLFTIGLWKLHQNGTKILDDQGDPIPTYDNRDIMTTSRGWTGLDRQASRWNYEAWNLDQWPTNEIDPMRVPTRDTRDVFPKLWLDDNGRKYVGDAMQRCDSMPKRAFLKKGATYRFLGTNSLPELGRADPDWWKNHETWNKRLVLDETNSALFAALCNEQGNGNCQFQSYVVLDSNLVCSGNCEATPSGRDGDFCECDIDEPRVVRLEPSAKTASSQPLYFEYVRAPCISLAFPDGDTYTVKALESGGEAMCADAKLPVAGAACCLDDGNGLDLADPFSVCVYQGERVTYATAELRCAENGGTTCPWDGGSVNWACGNGGTENHWVHWASGLHFTWTDSPCSVKAQINVDGDVAIVHDVDPLPNPVKERVAPNVGTYFRAIWDEGEYPSSESCVADGCEVPVEEPTTCICPAAVSSVQAITTLPTSVAAISALSIGASDPALFDAGVYGSAENGAGYNVYNTVARGALGIDTIFEVLDPNGGESKFFLNIESSVAVGGGKSFRNPPMLNSAIDATQRDALAEIDEMLNFYTQHSSVAPFLATRLIQLLITSNPSPAYVEDVADAFSTGSYGSFGDGNYGNLEAMVAAIFLHPEARSETLDADPMQGIVREPFLQLIHFLRAMELGADNDREVRMVYLRERLGQEPHNAPSVFGDFLFEHSPLGPVLDSGLVSPQSQLLDAPKIVGFINGFASTASYGLNDCQWWTGFGDSYERYTRTDYPDEGSFSCDMAAALAPMQLQWEPDTFSLGLSNSTAVAAGVVAEMDLLLTAGRLDEDNRKIIEESFVSVDSSMGQETALRSTQALFAMTPEFRITNNLRDAAASSNPEIRLLEPIELPISPPAVTEYKALVYLYMAGGTDSYNLVVPHSGCGATNLPTQYQDMRGDVAIPSASLLPVQDASGTQPCSHFGFHPSLTQISSLYSSGDAAVVANIGPLVEPLDSTQYDLEVKEFPPALFAHNTQTDITMTVDPLNSTANGILGRIGDAINAQNCLIAPGPNCSIFDAYSVSGSPTVLEGAPGVSRVADVLTGSGVSGLNGVAGAMESTIRSLHEHVATSIYGETVSASTMNTFNRIDLLGHVLEDVTLLESCWEEETGLKNQLRTVATVMAMRNELAAKRDVFYVQIGGFDTHSDNGPQLEALLGEVDDAVHCFHQEMEAQQLWASNVTVVTASEFGRTLTSNGFGTDHGWSGNHLVMGGAVQGGRFYGHYPSDITESSDYNIGRGRLIPTTSWDSVWDACARWFGVESAHIADILPNLGNFAVDDIMTSLFA